jgi:hypothetical protein
MSAATANTAWSRVKAPAVLCPLVAVVLASIGAFWIGGGAVGPDAAGAQAASVLGGHPYPLHPFLIKFTGSGRLLSILAAGVTAFCGVRIAPVLGGSPLATGLALAAAPLLLSPATGGGGDAPAVALALAGVALACGGQVFAGALLATSCLAVKPIALPVLGLLWLSIRSRRHAVEIGVALAIGGVACRSLLEPLLAPRPGSGLLGSWWLASGGDLPALGELPALAGAGVSLLLDLPAWTGHPVLGILALGGAALPGPARRERIGTLCLGLFGLLAVATGLGDHLRPRYLGPATLPLVLLAGVSLARIPWAALLGAWPALALVSHVAGLRALEEDLPLKPMLVFPGLVDVAPQFRDISVCGGAELSRLATDLAEKMPTGSEVVALRLRDGREGDLFWPLQAARPDLQLTVLTADCCAGEPEACARTVWEHLRSGGALVSPLHRERCDTEVVDPAEHLLAVALGASLESKGRFAHRIFSGIGTGVDACAAARQPRAVAPPRSGALHRAPENPSQRNPAP